MTHCWVRSLLNATFLFQHCALRMLWRKASGWLKPALAVLHIDLLCKETSFVSCLLPYIAFNLISIPNYVSCGLFCTFPKEYLRLNLSHVSDFIKYVPFTGSRAITVVTIKPLLPRMLIYAELTGFN